MIYYVEDDANIRELALYALRQAGFEASGFSEGQSFFAGLKEALPELVLLDIMLPGMDGLEILRRLREDAKTSAIPVMMLTAKGTEYDTVTGLDAGADDYLSKPFGMMELVSRVNALLRRAASPGTSDGIISCGSVSLDPGKRTVSVAGKGVELTRKEFDLLQALLEGGGRVLTRDVLLERVWDMAYCGESRTVDVHVQTLRQKLNDVSPGAGSIILTVRGIGYRACEA